MTRENKIIEIEKMYQSLKNKDLFLLNFGTTKFSKASDNLIDRMYKYLINNK